MSVIIISNVSTHGDLAGVNQYIVRIGRGHVLAAFEHVRSEGLATCLRKAADAVEAAKLDEDTAWLETAVRALEDRT